MTAHLCSLNPFPVLLLHRRSSNQILFAFPLKLNILYLPNEGFLLRQLCSATKAHELFLVFHCRRLTLDFVSSHTLLKRSHRHGRRPKSGWRRWKTRTRRSNNNNTVFRPCCNSTLMLVSSGKRQVIQDSNHSCCQIWTPSEIQLIA